MKLNSYLYNLKKELGERELYRKKSVYNYRKALAREKKTTGGRRDLKTSS